MRPYDPLEVLVVTDRRDKSTVAAFTRITEDYWAKPGALVMYSLEAITEDCTEHQKIKRYLVGRS